MGSVIQYIVYAAAMWVIYAVIHYLNNRDNMANDSGQSDENYVVKIPAALKYVYLSMFVMGMILFVVFTFFRIRGVSSVNIGLIRFSLIVAAIGLLVMVWACRWRICVDGTSMEIHKLFHRAQTVTFSEIEKVGVTKKFQLVLYKDGKRILVVDLLSDNYERFKRSLEENGKL